MEDMISACIRAQIEASSLQVTVEGNRALIEVVSSQFAGLNRVKRQQLVYGCINDLIADGSLHAVTIKASTPDE